MLDAAGVPGTGHTDPCPPLRSFPRSLSPRWRGTEIHRSRPIPKPGTAGRRLAVVPDQTDPTPDRITTSKPKETEDGSQPTDCRNDRVGQWHSAPGLAAAAGEVEVLHWWTSGGEAAALNVLKQDLESKGVTWQDMPVAGGGGTEAMTALRARVTAGNAPTAVQMLGFDILDWAMEGALGNLNAVASEEGWDDVVPTALQAFGKHDGNWISAPVNVHSTNWVWINKGALDAAGGKAPESWEELVAVLDAR